MTNSTRILIGAMVLGFATSGVAEPITGSLSFEGDVEAQGNASISEADALTFANVEASQGTGDFSNLTDEPVSYNDVTIEPFNGPVTLWDGLAHGGEDFAFELEEVNSIDRDPTAAALAVGGEGTLKSTTSGSDFEDTTWTWNFSANEGSLTNVTFSAAQADVPEPTSVALLGLGLIGVAFAAGRRRDKGALTA